MRNHQKWNEKLTKLNMEGKWKLRKKCIVKDGETDFLSSNLKMNFYLNLCYFYNNGSITFILR